MRPGRPLPSSRHAVTQPVGPSGSRRTVTSALSPMATARSSRPTQPFHAPMHSRKMPS